MTVAEALCAIRRVGTVEYSGDKMRLRFPEGARAEVRAALEALRKGKAEAIALMSSPDAEELSPASAILNQAGVRIMRLDDTFTIGVWGDLDGPDIRAALNALGMGRLPVRYLDENGIPERYKVRYGKPAPMP